MAAYHEVLFATRAMSAIGDVACNTK